MRKASDILYRFRGYILAIFAIALIACPAAPFPHNFSRMAETGPYFGTLLFYALGILLRIKSRQYIGQHTRGSAHSADTLVTDGPYAHMRHPLYTSNTYIALGAIFFHLGVSGLFHVFIIAIALFEYALARAEDRFLEQKFGDTWRAWAQKTPMSSADINAILGDKKANSGASLPQRTVFQAFKADASTWFWFVFFNLIMVLLKIYTV